jgi:hypothetical protein
MTISPESPGALLLRLADELSYAATHADQFGGNLSSSYPRDWANRILAIASSLEGQVEDSARLDALELDVAEEGPIVLHNGEGTSGNYRGLGMANTGRTLRDAIDGLRLYVKPVRAAQQESES